MASRGGWPFPVRAGRRLKDTGEVWPAIQSAGGEGPFYGQYRIIAFQTASRPQERAALFQLAICAFPAGSRLYKRGIPVGADELQGLPVLRVFVAGVTEEALDGRAAVKGFAVGARRVSSGQAADFRAAALRAAISAYRSGSRVYSPCRPLKTPGRFYRYAPSSRLVRHRTCETASFGRGWRSQ